MQLDFPRWNSFGAESDWNSQHIGFVWKISQGILCQPGCIQSALVLKVQNRLLPRCQLSVLDGLYIKGPFSSKLFVKHKPIWKIFLINCSNDGKKMGYTILFPPSANQTKFKIIKFGNLVLVGLKYSQSFAPER